MLTFYVETRIIITLPMADALVRLFSVVLLCITAAQGKEQLHSNSEWPKSFSVIRDTDGISKVAETQGYTCEEHKATTEDGYILSLQRLPAGQSGKKAHKPPVLLQHGLFCDAIVWVVNPPDESLGFILADNGYDVWLANVRGTKYSRGHISLHPNDMAYWDWSWDELARYDLPAFVQYVYNQTGQRMHYAGHSLGTLMVLADLSRGKLLDMLRSAALLCPIAHLNHVTSPVARTAAQSFIADPLYWLGLREFIPNGDAASKLVGGICHILNLINCSNNLLTLITGPNCCLNSSAFNAYLDHGLPPTATKNLIHLCQMIRTAKIAKYDYGDQRQNMQHYGQRVPPLYNMTKISNEFPLFLTYGRQDALSNVKDVQLLLNDLRDHDGNKLVVLFTEDYSHYDFIMGVNVNQIIYDPMIVFFEVN
ncbi:Triacylglycerol lipase 2 [Glycine max]|nr:Triacylglycerol lipase 2 [Glycine max]